MRANFCNLSWAIGAFLVCIAFQAASASDSKLLDEAARHAGDKVIKTGEFRYLLRVDQTPPTKEEIERRVEQQRKMLRERLERTEIPRLREQLTKSIETVGEDLPRQYIEMASRRMQFQFLVSDAARGGDRLAEFSFVGKSANEGGGLTTILKRDAGGQPGLSIFLPPGGRMAIAGPNNMYAGSEEPQRLGRLIGFLASIVSSPPQAGGVTNITTKPLGAGGDAGLQELSCEGGLPGKPAMRFTVHVDPSRGYITPLVQEATPDGALQREWKCEDYFQPAGSDLWFPGVCIYRETRGQARVERYEFAKDGVKLNVAIPKERFNVTLNPEFTLIDTRSSPQARYEALAITHISLDDLSDLAAVKGLEAVKPRVSQQSQPDSRRVIDRPAETVASPWSRGMFAINAGVVLVLLVVAVRRRLATNAAAKSSKAV